MIRNQMDSSADSFLFGGGRGGFSGLEDFPSAEARAADLRRIASFIRLLAAALNHLADALSREDRAATGVRMAARTPR